MVFFKAAMSGPWLGRYFIAVVSSSRYGLDGLKPIARSFSDILSRFDNWPPPAPTA